MTTLLTDEEMQQLIENFDKLDKNQGNDMLMLRYLQFKVLNWNHSILFTVLVVLASNVDVLRTRDEPLRTSAWEAIAVLNRRPVSIREF